MARVTIEELAGQHFGQDVWVVAAGPSAGFVEPGFFDNKITIGVNRVWTRFKTDYLVVKEANVLQQAIDAGSKVVASKHHCGSLDYQINKARGDFYYFDHQHNELEDVDLEIIGTDKLVVSFSTITSAIHLAAYMGAANIIIVGHDCGSIDGKLNFDGYPINLMQDLEFYKDFLSRIERQTLMVRDRLVEVYGCRIHSLNPWINFNLEDHSYERFDC